MSHLCCLRGGGYDEEGKQLQIALKDKIKHYREKIRKSTNMDEEFKFYIEPRVKANVISGIDSEDSFELALSVKKDFLDNDGPSKVFLLTGKHRSGKTLFCKYFTKFLLLNCNAEDQETDWLPIYINLSHLKEDLSSQIIKVLAEEILLNKEEITLLKSCPVIQQQQLRLLLIIDGYERNYQIEALTSKEDYIQNNFYMLNNIGKDWTNAKLIITCGEDSLCLQVHQKELLFAPINLKTASSVPGSVIERILQPFSDNEITSYLKRYIVMKGSESVFKEGLQQSDSVTLSGTDESWGLVKKYEEIIDGFQLKKELREPFLLSIAVDVLCKIIGNLQSQDKELQGNITSNIQQILCLNRWTLLKEYIDKCIKAAIRNYSLTVGMTEENQGPYVETLFGKVVTKIQDQALLLSKYFYQSAQSETEYQKEIEELLIKYHPLMQVDGERKLIFEQASIQEFFVASRIEEEINHDFAYGNSFPRKNLLLNQRMLSGESLTFEFLVDAVQNKKITAEALLRIIKSSKREYQSESNDQNSALNLGSESSCKEEIRTTIYKQSYVIAASNAISILNATGYDFTNTDLSSIQLLNANLSFGIFKGANLTNADLNGANFRDVWLANADLTNSKLTKVQFEAFSGKIFKKSVSSNPIAYSKNGNLMAVVKGEKIVILERDCALRTSFKKKSTLSMHNEAISDCVFRPDGEKFIFVGMDGVLCISDVINSEQQSTLILEREKARGGFGKRYKLSADGKYVLFTDKGEPMMMWEVGKTVPVLKLKPKRTTFVGSELSSDSILILVSESDSTCSIWNARTGKKIHRLERPSPLNELVKLSFNSKKTLHVLSGNLFSMRDLVRSHSTKFLETIDRGCFLHQYTFSDDCKQIIFLTQNKIHFQDVASGKYLRSLQCREKLPSFTNPSFKLIANAAQLALADNNIIVFFELTCPETGSIRKGPNTKGLSLDGTNIDACTDISQEVLHSFLKKAIIECLAIIP